MLNHSIMMALFMIVNILLGSGIAIVDGTKQFDKTIFFRGCLKALIIGLSIVALNYAGTFVPDMVVITLNGENLTVSAALLLIIDGAIITYAYKSFTNLYKLLRIETSADIKQYDPNADEYHKDPAEEVG